MIKKDIPILLVDDEEEILFSYSFALKSAGFGSVTTASGGRKGMECIGSGRYELVVLDLYMPEVDGFEVLEYVVQKSPSTEVVIITAADDSQAAVKCIKKGASDYILKPVDSFRFITTVTNTLEKVELKNQVRSFSEISANYSLTCPENFSSIITQDNRMFSLFKYIETVAGGMQPVLICGETGTGKEFTAEAVHKSSCRKGSFVALNAAGVDDNVFTDTLFGHRKGAFTGADKARRGLLLEASGGTIFLDEVGDLSGASQLKLLRFLQEGTFMAVGSDVSEKSDVRVVLATNAELEEKVAEGTFRKDLYYRIATHKLMLPPLRERKGDIPLLFEYFFKSACAELSKECGEISSKALAPLTAYGYPGNIRELRGIAYDLAARCAGILTREGVAEYMEKTGRTAPAESSFGGDGASFSYTGRFPSLKDMETFLIQEALSLSGGNQSRAAELLGISRQALSKRLRK
jgi:DNA-binding NtrC family response regulator